MWFSWPGLLAGGLPGLSVLSLLSWSTPMDSPISVAHLGTVAVVFSIHPPACPVARCAVSGVGEDGLGSCWEGVVLGLRRAEACPLGLGVLIGWREAGLGDHPHHQSLSHCQTPGWRQTEGHRHLGQWLHSAVTAQYLGSGHMKWTPLLGMEELPLSQTSQCPCPPIPLSSLPVSPEVWLDYSGGAHRMEGG